MKKDNIISPKMKNVAVKWNSCSEKEHQLYISEAELQMHQAKTPLWGKTGVCYLKTGKCIFLMFFLTMLDSLAFKYMILLPTRYIFIQWVKRLF